MALLRECQEKRPVYVQLRPVSFSIFHLVVAWTAKGGRGCRGRLFPFVFKPKGGLSSDPCGMPICMEMDQCCMEWVPAVSSCLQWVVPGERSLPQENCKMLELARGLRGYLWSLGTDWTVSPAHSAIVKLGTWMKSHTEQLLLCTRKLSQAEINQSNVSLGGILFYFSISSQGSLRWLL